MLELKLLKLFKIYQLNITMKTTKDKCNIVYFVVTRPQGEPKDFLTAIERPKIETKTLSDSPSLVPSVGADGLLLFS